jgi:hypothetical protein
LFAIDSTTNKVYSSNYEDESISIYNGNESNRLEGTISFKAKPQSKWSRSVSSFTRNPSFVLVNEDLRVLYVEAVVTVWVGGGDGSSEQLLVVDLDTKEVITRTLLPETKAHVGFSLNRNDNTVFMKRYLQKAIVKYDGYLREIIHTTVLDNSGFLEEFLLIILILPRL